MTFFVLWFVTMCHWVNNPRGFTGSSAFTFKCQTSERNGLLEPEDEGIAIIRNALKYLPSGTALIFENAWISSNTAVIAWYYSVKFCLPVYVFTLGDVLIGCINIVQKFKERSFCVCVCVCVCVLAAPKYGTSEFDVIGLDISRRGLNSVDLAFMKLCIVIQLWK